MLLYIMSGHSKWSKIQHKKGKIDKKRGTAFTKLSKAITVAAQQGGGDPEMNFSLRLVIEKAKAENMPKDNIERAIKKGTGDLKDGEVYEEIVYEGFGPNGVAFIIEAFTENKNRTSGEIKHTFSKNGGSLGSPGSVMWQFKQLGAIRLSTETKQAIPNWEDLALKLMDAGVEDIRESEHGIEIYTPKEAFQTTLETITNAHIEPDDSGLEWIATEEVATEPNISEKIETLFEALDELDDVNAVYTNEQ
ncbi:MAG: YebC/PmpR family DNA-binding transcriptional regulator [Candidatus Magasanikbacteria bacterium CG10_big_fil_rev_8_21_14_0_10_38_6]|uniref:Probable transcriptional regulatory protein COU30_01855 n=1 Tax=Candidatus Magasanikbacteria bacterium CG10_big_fil_rev_8_21_14_0_10_38_6 TaxID=1974647 RepID=A0A2M6P1I6_9BACT|nr:MAG: YebC/PmpR family DNA-binding transcriptional regulator [Candidatus Magasanikbacteria bacterium CG10_big_fil_rev_8_21_14_0_10_38_6]